MCFDRIEHATGLLHKIFYCFFLFFLSHFLAVEDDELSQSTNHLLSVPLTLEYARILPWLGPSLFFSTSVASLMVFCVRLLSELVILLPTKRVTKHLTCHNKFR